MATLILSVVGTIVAGPIGGAIGALAGSAIDQAIGTYGNVQGPRLAELNVTTSAYGAALPRHFGAMRVAGTIIWASELAEHSATSGGKGKPSVTAYAYSSSFAVALGSRALVGIGRVWADGKLLRGAAGDLKVGGTMRFYPGDQVQSPDPLIAAAEGVAQCPAFRGIAYVVFEDLQLANFGNRIPTLSFEVFADVLAPGEMLSLSALFDGFDGIQADVPLDGIAGFSNDGPIKDTLAQFQPVIPLDCNASGGALVIAPARAQTAPIALAEPAVSVIKGDFGGKAGFARMRAPPPVNRALVLRYYDQALDYQPGSQRAPGQPGAGQPLTIQLPAAIAAGDAFALVARCAGNASWSRDTLSWRSSALDPAVGPGAVVAVTGVAGQWRVASWEWRETGIELALERLAPDLALAGMAANAGRANIAADLPLGATTIAAFEVPWDGTGSADVRAIYAAVSASGAGWGGAALFADPGDGVLAAIGNSGRRRATIGTTVGVLPAARSQLFDRVSQLEVELLSADMVLSSASLRQLAMGANRALVGAEFIQFGEAVALGAGRWRLGRLLRGRGGTEGAIGGHGEAERFVLLDGAAVTLDPALVGNNPAVAIAAIGVGEAEPVESAVAGWGASLRPPCPVHAQAAFGADGGVTLAWTRRARGGWLWLDGVDEALVEQAEAYDIGYGPVDAPVARWQVAVPNLALTAGVMAGLIASLPHGGFWVRQTGTYAPSEPLLLSQL